MCRFSVVVKVAGTAVTVLVPSAEPASQLVGCSEGRYSAIIDVTAILDGVDAIQVSVSQSDQAGNVSTIAPVLIDKDTQVPVLGITDVGDGGDAIINATEAQSFSVMGDVSDALPGDTVTLVLDDAVTLISETTTVGADSWLVDRFFGCHCLAGWSREYHGRCGGCGWQRFKLDNPDTDTGDHGTQYQCVTGFTSLGFDTAIFGSQQPAGWNTGRAQNR